MLRDRTENLAYKFATGWEKTSLRSFTNQPFCLHLQGSVVRAAYMGLATDGVSATFAALILVGPILSETHDF